jgi:hypothetical protein
VGLAAIAHADGGAPRDVTGLLFSDPAVPTEATPKPRESALWRRLGGVPFGQTSAPSDSPTPATVDFYAVRFRTPQDGYAGGAACGPATPFDQLDACTRVPVIWRYTEPAGESPKWEEVFRGAEPGYVGGIAYLGPGRVLAVGGTGRFPRREADPSTPASDEAGRGQAWSAEDGRSWSPVPNLPEGMRGMSALDASPQPSDCGAGDDCAFAGGFQQLWKWRDGRFDATPTGPGSVTAGDGWRFRVRQIRFAPSYAAPVRAVAVTSGCCSADKTQNAARLLLYDGARWYARLIYGNQNSVEQAQTLPDSYYSVIWTRAGNATYLSLLASAGGPAGSVEMPSSIIGGVSPALPPESPPTAVGRALGTSGGLAGSTYGVAGLGSGNRNSDVPYQAATATTSDLRLVGGDGDFASPPANLSQTKVEGMIFAFPPSGPDTVMDWAIGAFRASGQGGAFTTTATPVGPHAPNALSCGDAGVSETCKARDPNEAVMSADSGAVIKLDSYALNAFTFADSAGGAGWAVGDRGALLRYGGKGELSAQTREPAPPKLGASQQGPLSNRGPYEPFAPIGGPLRAGQVPPLSARGTTHAATPQLVPAGSPDPSRPLGSDDENVGAMAMSRDGSEGWAVGPGGAEITGQATSLFHYSAGRWTRCATEPAGDQVPSDPRCAPVAAIRRVDSRDGSRPVSLFDVARVPLENDSDPSNDEDFEAAAIGTSFKPAGLGVRCPAVLRYRGGHWSVDQQAETTLKGTIASCPDHLSGVAFSAPDDGWIVASAGAGIGGEPVGLYHYDGRRWASCRSDPGGCDDPGNALALDHMRSGEDPRLLVAGRRVYLYGTRSSPGDASNQTSYPVVLYRDAGARCERPGDAGCWHAEDGGLDPREASRPDTGRQGAISGLSVARNGDGSYSGWAVGRFGNGTGASAGRGGGLLHLEERDGKPAWVPWSVPDSSADYLPALLAARPYRFQLLALPGPNGEGRALLAPNSDVYGAVTPIGPALAYDPARRRWSVAPTPFTMRHQSATIEREATVRAFAPDGSGGAWVAARQVGNFGYNERRFSYRPGVYFYRYTDRVPKPVFDDVAHPVREQITATAAGGDQSFWAATNTGTVYRYDRLTGWERRAVPGWDAGRIVTRVAGANAVAVGPDGRGVVVGQAGRIADVGPGGVALDAAAGGRCPSSDGCGTTHDLRAAAVAPDGSTMVAGDDRAVLWRPPGGSFRAVDKPPAAVSARLTGVALPTPDRAWVTTDTGQVFAGERSGDGWAWRPRAENVDAGGAVLNQSPDGDIIPLKAIAIDGGGHGFAVGHRGLILERTGDGDRPWRRLDTGYLDDFYSVAISPGGEGALVGGGNGLVLTRADGRFEVARPADPYDGVTNAFPNFPGRIVGVAIQSGASNGQTEAWAAEQLPLGDPPSSGSYNRDPPPNAILHYTSDPADSLLRPDGRVRPVADTPPHQPGEISFAAFGDSACHLPRDLPCFEPMDGNLTNELLSRRTVDAILAAGHEADGPAFALFTGDVDQGARKASDGTDTRVGAPNDPTVVHRLWADQVADRFRAAGVPLYGAIGGQDLAETGVTATAVQMVAVRRAGLNGPWRQALAGMPAPWGAGDSPAGRDGLSFKPRPALGAAAPGGGARTHYALDVMHGDKPVARVVVADTSMRSLAASEPQQNPVEPQTSWLDDALKRPESEKAIVLSNTPTYSYGPGAATDTQADGAAFEAKLLQNNVNVAVSGRLGWNGLYWTRAPGVHEPCAGGSYQEQPSATAAPLCQAGGAGSPASGEVGDALANGGPVGAHATGAMPFVVASSAGGPFGPGGENEGSSGNGFWHGYTTVRLEPDGTTVVEQRPILDWVGITAPDHVLGPRQSMVLHGYGREPVGTDTPIHYVTIDAPDITHRYDLFTADAERPWLPKVGPDGSYVAVSPDVATVDRTTGEVKVGSGNHPRAYAVAVLSVGSKAASYPLVLEPRRSFRLAAPPAPARILAPGGLPPVQVLAAGAAAVPGNAPPPPPPPPPGTASPATPAVPGLPPPASPAAAPPPAPPAPPPPPPPPGLGQGLPLALSAPLSPVSIQATVIPPTPPPIQPAPPSGGAARKEAKQRQAAAAKSEEAGQDQGAADQARLGGDRADGPEMPGHAMSRHRHPFTAVVHTDQPSAWVRGALYGGTTTLTALLLALAFTALRPRGRRRAATCKAPVRTNR